MEGQEYTFLEPQIFFVSMSHGIWLNVVIFALFRQCTTVFADFRAYIALFRQCTTVQKHFLVNGSKYSGM